ncbi:hypothetical protein GCM10017673_28910 [Streptosporangium violaceochromogenes]|nr:hypothetical protein GCM10017673_28910 [Streptosporangium violaceochromogenes]
MTNLSAPALSRNTLIRDGCGCFAGAVPLPMGCARCGHAPYAHGCPDLPADHEYAQPDGALMNTRLEARRCGGPVRLPRFGPPAEVAPGEVIPLVPAQRRPEPATAPVVPEQAPPAVRPARPPLPQRKPRPVARPRVRPAANRPPRRQGTRPAAGRPFRRGPTRPPTPHGPPPAAHPPGVPEAAPVPGTVPPTLRAAVPYGRPGDSPPTPSIGPARRSQHRNGSPTGQRRSDS